jgi:glyoxylase-like metal-dependent hydrolase (beta-lactamase superfamily II)
MKTAYVLTAMIFLGSAAFAASDALERLEPGPTKPFSVSGKGFINDTTHPVHPGSFRPYDATIRIALDPSTGEASIEIETSEGGDKDTDRYYVRRGRVFQVDDKGQEIAAGSLAEISAAAVAALHPALVASAMRENRQNVRLDRPGSYLFACNDVLWTVTTDAKSSRILNVKRREFSEVHGDGEEEVVFGSSPARATIRLRGGEVARFDFGAPEAVNEVTIPAGDARRDSGHVVAANTITFSELAPHLFTIDLAPLISRVMVAEFADYVVVIEGAYNARIGDQLARAIREKFGKPIRYFTFSHLHGQYIGSTRSFVAEGATIVVPETTAPLIVDIAKAPATLQPDALSKAPRAPKIETVKTSRRLEDATNALEIYNVVSEHTDEYFVFWFPGPKILLTGDLLFYRPGKPLTGRSKRVCRTVAELGLKPERYVATWPLDGFGTKNIVSGEEMRAACEVVQ